MNNDNKKASRRLYRIWQYQVYWIWDTPNGICFLYYQRDVQFHMGELEGRSIDLTVFAFLQAASYQENVIGNKTQL